MEIIYVPDIKCESCVKVISRMLQSQGISDFTINSDSVHINDQNADTNQVVSLIKKAGFRASTTPFIRKTLKERLRDFKENNSNYEIELRALRYSLLNFGILILLAGFSYLGFLKNIPNFLQNYGWWFFYLILAVTAIGIGLWHFFAYRTNVTCMVGMMVGMTFGMQTGLMIGAVLGATNGFFIGSLIGMLSGVIVGVATGRCCGIMGIMEGMMAGVMGGTMGPMITVMMFSDHLLWFMPIFMFINLLIVAGLSYMLYEELVENKENIEKKPIDFLTFSSLSLIMTFALAFIMIYGPKSALINF